MPVHDWTLVDAGVFHAFHTAWVGQIQAALNDGRLPGSYYALAEQHAGAAVADVLALHADGDGTAPARPPAPADVGGTAVADAPPRVRGRQTFGVPSGLHPRTVAVRHVSGHRIVALIEIVSPANKDRLRSVDRFAAEAAEALEADVHLLVADLLPPGRHDPFGMAAAVRQRLEANDEPAADGDRPPGEPLTLAAYDAGPPVEAYLDYLAVGASLPEMPLFLRPGRYVNVPLEETYAAAYRGLPAFWRDVLEGRHSPPSASV
jgi:hypothetical protein